MTTKPAVPTESAAPPAPSYAQHPEHVAASPGGDTAAFVVGPTGRGPDASTGIWLGRLDAGPTRVSNVVPDTNLVFAPDGCSLAFGVSDGDGSRIVVADTGGGRIGGWHEHPLPARAERLAWTPDALVVLAVGAAPAGAAAAAAPPADADPFVADPPGGWRRLWTVDPYQGGAEPWTPENVTVWQFAPRPGGGAVVVSSDDPTQAGWSRARLDLADTDGSLRPLVASPWQLSSPAVSPDGARVAYVEGWASDRGLLAAEIRIVETAGTAAPVTVGVVADVTWLSWDDTGRLWLAGWHHLGTAWGWVDGLADLALDEAAAATVHLEKASCLNSRWHPEVVPLPDRTVLTVRSSPLEPPEVTRLDPHGPPRSWTALNAGVGATRQMRVRELRWQGPDGLEIEGLLAEPRAEAAPSTPRPLVLDIHGGPSLAWHHSWDLPWAELLSSAGYAVLMANPRGSAGRGGGFSRANLTDPVGAEFGDLLAGVARCVADGVADPDRVAAIGASYGGYLTAWAVATGSVACGVVIAGMSDLVSCWSTVDNPPFYDALLGGALRDTAPLYLERSPITRTSPASAPALILHGHLDRCVPVGQAIELHTSLRAAGVPAELVVYPREGHHVKEPGHVADQHARVLAWLGTYLA